MLQDLLSSLVVNSSLVAVFLTLLTAGIVAWFGYRNGGKGVLAEFDPETRTFIVVNQEATAGEPKPFEVVALAKYYDHALLRANVSFWFSIIFGAVGFGVIVLSFATHAPGDSWGTLIKAGSGVVIDAVASLFFVQSTNAQKSMTQFFENLRLDRLNVEARGLISEIEDVERRDQLRAQLVLKYAGIDRLLVGS